MARRAASRGSHPLWRPVPGDLGRRLAEGFLCRLQLGPPRRGPDFKSELLPLRSPLLRQSLLVSFPPLIDMLKFSGSSYLIRGQLVREVGAFDGRGFPRRLRGRGGALRLSYCARECRRARHCFWGRTRVSRSAPTPSRRGLEGGGDARTGMPAGMPAGAMCVQRFDGSLYSAIHITYRISLRSSSMPEPRDPLLKVVSVFQ
uniref:Uncharacterized protein n=1 Tax=Brassica oleracea var. oleracea TaxID=109376 RepID=A0A0D2ZVC6_BRAOL